MGSLHTATFPGKRVCVKLKDGTVIIDKFVDRANGHKDIVLEEHGRISISKIKSFFPYMNATNSIKRT